MTDSKSSSNDSGGTAGLGVTLIDLAIWGIVSLLIQLLVYRLVDVLLTDIPKRIEKEEAGAAVVLVSAKLASALIIAAGLWDPVLQRF